LKFKETTRHRFSTTRSPTPKATAIVKVTNQLPARAAMETPLLSEQQAALRTMPAVAAVEATKTLAAASLTAQMRNASGGYAMAREADRCVMRRR